MEGRTLGSYRIEPRDGDGFRQAWGEPRRAVRGGAFNLGADAARSAARGEDPADLHSGQVGVRPIVELAR